MGLFSTLKKKFGGSEKSEPRTEPLSSVPPPTPVAPEMPDVSGTFEPVAGLRLNNKYLLEKELGRGGIGITFLAKDFFAGPDSPVSKQVVVKVLLDSTATSSYLEQKFHQEYEALSRINHPYVVKVLDVGTLPNGKAFFVMDYILGQPLSDQLRRGALPLPLAGKILRQISLGLQAAHDAGVIHRDLKPDNVMLENIGDGDVHAKLIDFGVARVERSDLNSTGTPMAVGTLLYMSPEQMHGEKVGPATDIFALGVIGYEMLTGRRPFQPTTDNKVAAVFQLSQMQKAGVSVPPKELRPDIPEALNGAVLKALAYRPDQRFASVAQFGEAFANALSGTIASGVSGFVNSEAVTQAGFPPPVSAIQVANLEPVGGGMDLGSRFYVQRTTDDELNNAVSNRHSIILIKGPRQVGKTSLMARGLQLARDSGSRVAFIDFQTLTKKQLETSETLFLALGQMLEEQLDLDTSPSEIWKPERGATMNFNRYLKNVVLAPELPPFVLGMDEVDRLFFCAYGSEVFGLFRSWHNARAGDPTGPWRRLTLVMSYAVEAHLFITDLNQSPFNVGTRLTLADFDLNHIRDLNDRYGSPIPDEEGLEQFFELLGGKPFLVRMGLHELVSKGLSVDALAESADADDGPFGEHFQRLLTLLQKDDVLCDVLRTILKGQVSQDMDSFFRLRSAGIVSGDTAADMQFRSLVYQRYLARHLL
jgi:serine/threonine protein kinase